MTFKKTNGLYGITLTNDKKYTCSNCSSTETYISIRKGRGTPIWHNYNGNKLCNKCYQKLVSAPKYRKKHNERLKSYRLDYIGINLYLSFILPKDKCEICGILKGQGKKIDRHHYFYCRIMPWVCTMSVCNSCHGNITNENERIRKNVYDRICLLCNTDNPTKNKKGKPIWLRYENGHICIKCYEKLRYQKKKKMVGARGYSL